MTALAEVIRAHWETWRAVGGPVVDRAAFRTDDADVVAATVDAWCAAHLGSDVAGALAWTTSIGCVGLVVLADGRRVAVKVHQPDRSTAFLEGIQAVQRTVVAAGVPAPLPLAGPAPIRPRGPLATADAFVPDPGPTDGRAPGAAQAAAVALALATRATEALPADSVASHPMDLAPGRLYPEPHSPVFDFDRTAAGAAWIDERARAAREVLDAHRWTDELLVHQDWCSRNVRVVDGRVVAAYDWDAVSRAPLWRAIGHAAALWPCTGEPGSPMPSSASERDEFIDAFAAAWGSGPGDDDRRAAHASADYTLAYLARCEHAIGRDGPGTRFLRADR